MRITLTLRGSAAEYLEGSGLVQAPGSRSEELFVMHWRSATRKAHGSGYRLTLTVPAWVLWWIYEELEPLTWSMVDASNSERNAARDARRAIRETAGPKVIQPGWEELA